MGKILEDQRDPNSLGYFKEALGLYERIGGKIEAANIALDIGFVYLRTSRRDLGQAEQWTQRSLDSRSADDRAGQAACLAQLGSIAVERFGEGIGNPHPDVAAKAWQYLNDALVFYQQALPLTPADNPQNLRVVHQGLGRIYALRGDIDQSMMHDQQAL